MTTYVTPLEKQKTTIILGAGSNKDMGFSLGYEIYKKAINDILIDTDSDLYKIMLKFSEDHFIDVSFVDFARSLKYSSSTSIDEFIYNHPIFEKVAKIIYGFYITNEENNFELHDPEINYWYKEIWTKFLHTRNLEDFPKRKISFITFNYDRSLEYFIYENIYNTYYDRFDLENFEKRIELFNRIPILHVYGKLSDLPSENQLKYLEYGYNDIFLKLQNNQEERIKYLIPRIKQSNENIKLIYDERSNNKDHLDRIHTILNESNNQIFLGFDFNEINMAVLFSEKPSNKVLAINKRGFIYNYDPKDKFLNNKIENLKKNYEIITNTEYYKNIMEFLRYEIIL